MQAVTTIGFDIAKSVFQVHGVDSVGQVIIRRQLKRRQVRPSLLREDSPCQPGAVHTQHKADIPTRSINVRFWGFNGQPALGVQETQ